MSAVKVTRKRWPKGAWMKLRSTEMMRLLMQQNGLSLRLLGEDAHVHWTFIHQLLKGTKTTCTPRVAEAIARALRVPLEVLFEPKLPTAASQTASKKVAA